MKACSVSHDGHTRKSKFVVSFDTCLKTIRHMRVDGSTRLSFCAVIITSAVLSACASGPTMKENLPPGVKSEMTAVKMEAPVTLRLKAAPKSSETVEYFHISASRAFEGKELRHEKTETVAFTAQSETLKVDKERFTQAIKVTQKEGKIDLHDFAMPEMDERLEIVADSRGRILKAGDWPANSIFYVSPVSLPEQPVEAGDTWTMQASWLSLQDMVPYELDMVSILKGFVKCGNDTCADIEVNGNVAMQGALKQALVFRSEWRGRLLFAVNAGTVIWSRVNSEETFAYDRVYRIVGSCLEAALREPQTESIMTAAAKPSCEGFTPPTAAGR